MRHAGAQRRDSREIFQPPMVVVVNRQPIKRPAIEPRFA